MSAPFRMVPTVPKRQRPAPKGLLRGHEVEALLNIGRTTRFEWTHQRILEGTRLHPRGHWFYDASQPVIAARLAAAKARR